MPTLNCEADELLLPVEGYEGLYKISNFGRVFSYYLNDFLIPAIDKGGYLRVGLSKDNQKKMFSVHQLVSLHFVNGYESSLEVNHIDENKTNNHHFNLEWCTRAYNNRYSKADYWLITFPTGLRQKVCNLKSFCREMGLSQGNMCQVSKGIRQQHKGYRCEKIKHDSKR